MSRYYTPSEIMTLSKQSSSSNLNESNQKLSQQKRSSIKINIDHSQFRIKQMALDQLNCLQSSIQAVCYIDTSLEVVYQETLNSIRAKRAAILQDYRCKKTEILRNRQSNSQYNRNMMISLGVVAAIWTLVISQLKSQYSQQYMKNYPKESEGKKFVQQNRDELIVLLVFGCIGTFVVFMNFVFFQRSKKKPRVPLLLFSQDFFKNQENPQAQSQSFRKINTFESMSEQEKLEFLSCVQTHKISHSAFQQLKKIISDIKQASLFSHMQKNSIDLRESVIQIEKQVLTQKTEDDKQHSSLSNRLFYGYCTFTGVIFYIFKADHAPDGSSLPLIEKNLYLGIGAAVGYMIGAIVYYIRLITPLKT